MDKTRIVTGRHAPVQHAAARVLRKQMTPAEALLWQRLRNRSLGGLHFRRQQVIDGYIADFYCHAAGLVVEADGGKHRASTRYDRTRDRIVAARGFCVLRFANGRIEHDIEGVLADILRVASARLSGEQVVTTGCARPTEPPTPSLVRKGSLKRPICRSRTHGFAGRSPSDQRSQAPG